MSEALSRRLTTAALVACLVLVAPAGCRSRAHSDLYQQRMASEIRVLEDQLYDADYQNRVLADKLEQLKVRAASPVRSAAPSQPPPPTKPKRERDSEPSSDSKKKSDDGTDIGSGLESPDDLQLPMFDEGVPVDPEALTDPLLPPELNPSGQSDLMEDASPDELLPAPGGPEPPGKKDTEIPPILPGEMLPPPAPDEKEAQPPGKINLPDSVQAAAGGTPDRLRIHPALSGGQRVDGHLDGMLIVVNVIDKLGRTVDLETFDVDAELSIVILDPQRDPAEARLGRWDFSRGEVAKLVRGEPISGLHVPIQWQESEPSGKEVIVHIRLRGEVDEMRCEQRLKVERQTAIAEWTPRGDALQR